MTCEVGDYALLLYDMVNEAYNCCRLAKSRFRLIELVDFRAKPSWLLVHSFVYFVTQGLLQTLYFFEVHLETACFASNMRLCLDLC